MFPGQTPHFGPLHTPVRPMREHDENTKKVPDQTRGWFEMLFCRSLVAWVFFDAMNLLRASTNRHILILCAVEEPKAPWYLWRSLYSYESYL